MIYFCSKCQWKRWIDSKIVWTSRLLFLYFFHCFAKFFVGQVFLSSILSGDCTIIPLVQCKDILEMISWLWSQLSSTNVINVGGWIFWGKILKPQVCLPHHLNAKYKDNLQSLSKLFKHLLFVAISSWTF